MCSGEPSRKAGSPKLHPSKPGGTFVGSNARQVEVEMKRRSVPHSRKGRVLGSTPSPGGVDSRPRPLLSGQAPPAYPQWYTAAGTRLSVGPLHQRSLIPGKSFPAGRTCPSDLLSPRLSASSLAWYILQRSPPTPASGDNSTVRWPERGVDKGKRQFFNPYY